MMGRVANVETILAWRKRLRRQGRSGFSVAEFCRRENVSPASFYAWRKVPNVKVLPDLPLARLDDRRHLLKQLDGLNRHLDASGMMDAMDHYQREAVTRDS